MHNKSYSPHGDNEYRLLDEKELADVNGGIRRWAYRIAAGIDLTFMLFKKFARRNRRR